MATLTDVLDELRKFPSNAERGIAFEKLMVRFFQESSIYETEFDKVCRWVDVVQVVGRVMRKSPDKDYGYIMLPASIPAGRSLSEVLSDNAEFKVVWQILNALRANDECFDAIVNSTDFNGSKECMKDVIDVVTVDPASL